VFCEDKPAAFLQRNESYKLAMINKKEWAEAQALLTQN